MKIQSTKRRFKAASLKEVVDKGVYSEGRPATVQADLLGAEVKIAPSALCFVKEQALRSMARYGVAGEAAREFIPAALIAAGITAAKSQATELVTVGNIMQGWSQELSLCPGNKPPFMCGVKSILGRKEVIYELPGLTGQLLRECFDMPGE